MERFTVESDLPVPAEEAFRWHARPGALERLSPPWDRVQVVQRAGGVEDGARATLRVGRFPLRTTWVAEHFGYQEGERFCDRQISGPFSRWEHRHEFEPLDEHRCRLRDDVSYAPPLGALGRVLGGRLIRRTLTRTFTYRHAVTAGDLRMHGAFLDRPRQTVAISGASGVIGSALAAALTTGGHRVLRLVRRRPRSDDELEWSVEGGVADPESLNRVDAVVHLAGEPIGARWSTGKKERIYASRVEGTRALAASLGQSPERPRALLCASAIGWYGDRGDQELDETAPVGDSFLARVCQDWEEAASTAETLGMRVVNLRIGMALTLGGGALPPLARLFALGLGGVVGDGRQIISWTSLDDVIEAIHLALMREDLSGPVNITSPRPVSNREFTKTLAQVLRRPAVLPAPASLVRALGGQAAEETALCSVRAAPARLCEVGMQFRHPDLESALRHALGRAR